MSAAALAISTPPPRPRLVGAEADTPSAPGTPSAFDWRELTEARRQTLELRIRIVKGWKSAKADPRNDGKTIAGIADDYLAHLECDGQRLTLRTLQRWEGDYSRDGEAGLCDGRWTERDGGGGGGERNDSRGPFAEFFGEVKRLYRDQRRRSIAFCHDHAELRAKENGWPMPSYKTTRRMIAAIPHRVVALRREGSRAYDAKHGPYIERDYTDLASNACWESDEHQYDVWVIGPDGKLIRPWLLAWMDVRSRFYTGFKISATAGDTSVILATFRSAGMANGFPESIHVDNGKIYDARAMQGMSKVERRQFKKQKAWCAEQYRLASGVLPRLGVETHHAIPYNAKAKTIERSFGTIEDRFCRQFDTYCGRSPAERPADLQKQIDAGKAPTLAEFTERFSEWLLIDYHMRPHEGDGLDGKTPAQVYAENLHTKRVLPEDKIDLLTRRDSGLLKVGRMGVTFEGLSYGANDLAHYWGREVYLLIDDADRSTVQVYEPNGRLICVARSNERLPYLAKDTLALKAAQREKARVKRIAAEYHQSGMRIADSTVDTLHRLAMQKRAALPSPTPNLVVIQTPGNVPSIPVQTDTAAAAKSRDSYELFMEVGRQMAIEQSNRRSTPDPFAQAVSRLRDEREATGDEGEVSWEQLAKWNASKKSTEGETETVEVA
jgi:putative transposase